MDAGLYLRVKEPTVLTNKVPRRHVSIIRTAWGFRMTLKNVIILFIEDSFASQTHGNSTVFIQLLFLEVPFSELRSHPCEVFGNTSQ